MGLILSVAYTAGSATEATKAGGAAVFIQCTDGEEDLALATRKVFHQPTSELKQKPCVQPAATAISEDADRSGRISGEDVHELTRGLRHHVVVNLI